MSRQGNAPRRDSKVRRAVLLVLFGALGMVVLKTLVASLESKAVFFPFKGEDATPAAAGATYRSMRLTTSDGEQIVSWLLEPPEPIADIVYFHGNGGNLSNWLPTLVGLYRANLRVLAIDYRGYGLSTGTPTEEGVYRDAEAAVRYAHQHRSAAPRPLVYWGRSLGGAIAAKAATIAQPDGLILESTFPDKAAVIRRQPLLRALNALSTYRFPTLEHLRGFSKPVLVIHGDADSIIDIDLGRELFEGLTAPKQFVTVSGADHNDTFDHTDTAYWAPIAAFIESLD
jgi:pimeloyl-ACP methyl ester carboxylesterase